MDEYFIIFGKSLPVFLLIFLGALFRRLNWLKFEADSSIMKLILNLLYPALIFSNTIDNPALKEISNWLGAPFFGLLTLCIGFLVAYYWPGWKGNHPSAKRTFAFTTGTFNYAYVPIPLAIALFPPATTGVLMVFNVGVEIGVWTVGLLVLTGTSNMTDNLKRLLNPPILAILIALPCNFLGLTDFLINPGLPESLWGSQVMNQLILLSGDSFLTAVRMAGDCSIPLALILSGASIYDLWHSSKWWREFPVLLNASLLRIGILPLLFLLIARFVPMTEPLKQVIILQAAMPAAIFPIVMTRMFHGDTKVALQVVLGTSAVSLPFIPLWIQFGLWWTQ